MNQDHFHKLEQMYLSAPVQKLTPGINIHIGDSKTTISLPVRLEYFHAAGAVHGSLYFRLLDDAAFFAVSSLVQDVFVLTTSYNIHLLRPVTKGILKAEGRVTFASRSSYVAESKLYDEEGKLVASGSGNFVKSRISLAQELGYR